MGNAAVNIRNVLETDRSPAGWPLAEPPRERILPSGKSQPRYYAPVSPGIQPVLKMELTMNRTTSRTVLGIITVTGLLAPFAACDDPAKETVAEQLEGRWATEEPIPMIVKTDFCTGTLEPVATEDWSIEWVIKKTSDDQLVEITMTFYRSNFTVTNTNCSLGTGYVPEPSPMFLEGHIDGHSVTIMYGDDELGVYDFVDNELSGDFSYSYCLIYCQEITAQPDGFSLKEL